MVTKNHRTVITILAAIVLSAAIIFGGTAITASAAQSSIPGDTLYPVKISMEQMRMSMARDAGVRAELQIKYAERRLEEAKSLIAEGRFQNVQDSILNFETHINNAMAEMDVIIDGDPALAADLLERIANLLSRYSETLSGLVNKIPEPMRTEVLNTLSDVSSNVNDNFALGDLSGWSGFEDFDDDENMNDNDDYNENTNDNYNDNDNYDENMNDDDDAYNEDMNDDDDDDYNEDMNDDDDDYNVNTNDNVNMSESCSFGSVTIDELTVPQNTTCTLNGTKVEGNIYVYGNAILLASDVWVGGNIQADHSARLEVHSGSYVGGNIQVVYSGYLFVSSVQIGGDLQAFNNSGGVLIQNNTIEGNLQCKENYPVPTGGGNTVYGNKEDQCSDL